MRPVMAGRVRCLLSVIAFGVTAFAAAQSGNISVTLGPPEIGENQSWQITVSVKNDRLREYDNFPDIKGLRKRGTSTSTQTNIINGKVSTTESVIMTYQPTGQGDYTLPAFSMKVNGETIRSPGTRIKVGPPVQVQRSDPFGNLFNRDPFEDLFGRRETEYIDVKEDAFLALSTTKDEVYTGEGFTATLAFYVANRNQAPMDFYKLGKQLADILKKIKPTNCWEENFNIENIDGEPVTIQGKSYTRFKIYQGTFYPLNTDPVTFPKVGLEMIKYKVASNPSFFGPDRKEDFKTFYTRPKTVRVKELPPHPLRDAVAVGNYALGEQADKSNVETGQSVKYDFKIYGEGNISAIDKPDVKTDGRFDLYEPNIRQNINRSNGIVSGTKSFSYYLVPKEPGNYDLADYFQWVYFNPAHEAYDTLRPITHLHVTGESKRNLAIESNDAGPFYGKMEAADNTIHMIGVAGWPTYAFNFLILVILGTSVYLVMKK